MNATRTASGYAESEAIQPAQLREAELPEGWRWEKLGDVCKTTSGGTPSRTVAKYFEGNIPWVKSGELPDGVVSEIEEHITEEAIRNSSAKLFPAGTLLIALYGATVGKLGVLSRNATTNQAVCGIFPPDSLDRKYLFWYLRLVRSDLIAQAIGGAQPNISQGILRNLLLPIAPLEQQKSIVAEIEKQFSRLDEAVANLKRVKANLKRYKASVLKAAVEGKLTEDWRKQHPNVEPASKLLERILAERRRKWVGRKEYKKPVAPDTTDLSKMPKGWVWATVEQLSTVVRGASPRPAGDPRYFGGSIPWITVGPITADGKPYLTAVPETVTEAGKERSRYIEPDTLLLTNSGATLGVPKITLIGGCINDGVAALLEVGDPLKLYLLYFLRTRTAQLRSVNQGAAQPNLNTSIIKAIDVPLPPHDEQEQIIAEVERRLSVIDELEATVESNLTRADRLRQSILGQAFSGKL